MAFHIGLFLTVSATLFGQFESEFVKRANFEISYKINRGSCRRPCIETHTGNAVVVNCTEAGCTKVPANLNHNTTKLILTRNNIRDIYKSAFISLLNLIYLDISYCHIRSIGKGSFDLLHRLEVLNLSCNSGIESFPDGIFSQLRNLRNLQLARTQSTCIFNPSLLLNLDQLRVLSLSRNRLIKFPDFQNVLTKKPLLPKLMYLTLKDNNIEEINKNVLRGLEESLETLDLIRNKIHFIGTNSFSAMTKLKQLQLDYNPISKIQCNAFQSITLEHLSIASCRFKPKPNLTCHSNMLQNVPNLEVLLLSRSIGLRIATSPLSSQKKLKKLNLLGTGVNELDLRNITSMLPNLSILNIYDNQISTLNADLWNNVALKVLRIGKNYITTLNAASFPQKLWNSLETVDFIENPFYCDCKLVWFGQWLHKTNARVLNLKGTICSGPPKRKGQSVFETAKPTLLECFRADYDWCLLVIFLFYLAIVSASAVISILHKFRWYMKYWYFKTKTKARLLQEFLDETEYEFDAFLSYSESDSRWVIDTLCPMLENHFNLSLCIHYRNWLIGRDIVSNIIDSIEKSRKTLMVVSNAFAASQWCHFEMTMAQTKLFEDDRDNLILILLEEITDCNMNPRLQLQMQKKTYVEWTENGVGQQLFWENLRQALSTRSTSIINSTPPRELFVSQDDI